MPYGSGELFRKKRRDEVPRIEIVESQPTAEPKEEPVLQSSEKKSPSQYTQEEYLEQIRSHLEDLKDLEHTAPEAVDDGVIEDKETRLSADDLLANTPQNRGSFDSKKEAAEKLSEILTPLRENGAPAIESAQESAEEPLELTPDMEMKEKQTLPRTFAEVSPEKKAELNAAEEEYLSKYKEFHKNKKVWNTTEPKELKELYASYNEKRSEYAADILYSAHERLKAKPGYSTGDEKADYEKRERILARYNRLIAFNELVRPSAQRRIDARKEALGERGQSIFNKGLGWVGKKNAELETVLGGKTQARVARALLSTLIMAPVAFTGGGLIAFAGWGTKRIGRLIGGSLFAGGVSTTVGNLYEKKIGRKRQAKADKELVNAGRSEWHLSAEEFAQIDKAREKLLHTASDDTVARHKALVKFFTALGAGAGLSAAMADWNSLHEHAASTGATETNPPHAAGHSAGQPAKEIPGIKPATASIPSAEHHVSAEVARGEGQDQLVIDTRAQLRELYPDLSKAPASVHAMLNGTPQHVREQLGLPPLKPCDTLTLDDHGRVVFTSHETGKPFTIIDEKGNLDHPFEKAHTNSTRHGLHHRAPKYHHAPAHEKAFDAHADHTAVANANKQEFLREQQVLAETHAGEVPAASVEHLPSTENVPVEHLPSTIENHVVQAPTHSGETSTLSPENIDTRFPQPYLSNTGGAINIFGGTADQQREFAVAYAQLHPGESVRFTVAKHGFLGGVKQHVEEIVAQKDGTVRVLKVGADGKPFRAIDPSKFTSILNR